VSALATPTRRAQLPLYGEGRGNFTPHPDRLSGGSRPTLGQRLDRVWEGLLAAGAAACPMCGSEMQRDGDTGHCTGCGTTLG
jgi:hypothetical protein